MRIASGAALILLYPVILYVGGQYLSPSLLALALVPILLWRARDFPGAGWMMLGIAALGLTAFGFGNATPLQLYPAFMNLALLVVFGTSLWFPPTIVERIARLRDGDLPSEAILYTRYVTRAWCLFFAINGAISTATALFCTDEVWFIYNGVIAYVLMGGMFGGEWLIRRTYIQARHE